MTDDHTPSPVGSPSSPTLLRWWRSWRVLPWATRIRILQLWLQLPCCMLLLRTFGFNRLYTWLLHHSPPLDPSVPTPAVMTEVRKLGHLTNLAARHHIVRPTCLHRSFLLWWLLRRRGLDARLQIGVRRTADSKAPTAEIEAHAWVEMNGQVINDAAEVQSCFATFPLDRIPAHARMAR
jgi:hypothetical protein